MPERIERDDAVGRVERERSAAGVSESCLLCSLVDGTLACGAVIVERSGFVALLPKYGVRFGHAIVTTRRHVESLSELGKARWLDMQALAFDLQHALVVQQRPDRCFIASLGSSGEAPMTCAHVHLHVVPVSGSATRPADVLTWRHGVMTAGPDEFEALASRLASYA